MSSVADYALPVEIPGISYFRDPAPYSLELGYTFANGITIAYHTYGQLNDARNNAVSYTHLTLPTNREV